MKIGGNSGDSGNEILKEEKLMFDQMVYTTKDLQTVLNIGRETAYSLMRNPSFPSIRIGARYIVEKEALKAWLKRYEGKEFII